MDLNRSVNPLNLCLRVVCEAWRSWLTGMAFKCGSEYSWVAHACLAESFIFYLLIPVYEGSRYPAGGP